LHIRTRADAFKIPDLEYVFGVIDQRIHIMPLNSHDLCSDIFQIESIVQGKANPVLCLALVSLWLVHGDLLGNGPSRVW